MLRSMQASSFKFLGVVWLATLVVLRASHHLHHVNAFSYQASFASSFSAVISYSKQLSGLKVHPLLLHSPRHLSKTTTTKLWNSPTDATTNNAPSPPSSNRPDLHPPTINAISQALLVRAQNIPNMPLRFIDNGSMEPWEVTLSAGKVAQQFGEEFQKKNYGGSISSPSLGEKEEEELQVMAGRIVAVITRFEELEEELLKRCTRLKQLLLQDTLPETEVSDRIFSLGVPEAELKAWQKDEKNKLDATAAAIDAACLFDETLRYNRARSMLAMFLHELEGPGLRRNNVVLPCMDVDFLSEDEWSMLLESKEENVNQDNAKQADVDAVQVNEQAKKQNRPSLHPITIEAIEEAFRLRAQNMTTSPLRIIDSQTEWFEVQYSAVKFADRFLQKYKSESFTEEELQTIGGRIVGVLMRLDDLEWEWNHRVSTSPLGQADSPSLVPNDQWKTTLGLYPDNVEQVCMKTIDMALLEESEFARARAERMLALFLGCVEGPAMKASGQSVPGGSEIDFIECSNQMELFAPRMRK